MRYLGWDEGAQPLREALTTLGNGYFATRGAGEECSAGGPHYPGTYLAGGYNRAESHVAGHVVENEDLVNWPNWLPLTFRCEDGDWFRLDDADILTYEQDLDIHHGVLWRRVRFRDPAGRDFVLESERIVCMHDPHAAAIRWVLTPLNWSGSIEIRSEIDGRVANRGVPRYRDLNGEHVEVTDAGASGRDAVYLVSRSRQSHMVVAQAARTRVVSAPSLADVQRRTETGSHGVAHYIEFSCQQNETVRVEKVLALHTSRDFAISEPCLAACKRVHRLCGFSELRDRHALAWENLWSRADLELAGEHHEEQLVLRFHVFHVLQTISENTVGRDVGVPARGLHGEAYRGHIFWDEIFVFPFLNLRIPELTRALLLYRYRRLDEARHAARAIGCEGAMFPWQSGSDGREESQSLHLNPKSGRWLPDDTQRQRHVNAAIAYNVWQYHQATGDMEFLSFYGAEMLLEIARFWASLATYDPQRDRYVIRGVVGPDEFHTRYPNAESGGLDNNAYTNVMAAWVLHVAQTALELLAEDRQAELKATLGISAEDLQRWEILSRRMYVPFHDEGIISQFEGWDALEDLDWAGLKQRHGDIQRLDRVLEAEGDDPNRYQATKQADVLMLFFLFSSEQLREVFERLGYDYPPHLIPQNVQYYLARTSHGSTLSRIVHAWVLARTDRKQSWRLFREALGSDIDDVQGGTTSEGIHVGAMAGTVDLVQRCYTGTEMRRGVLWLKPRLPEGLDELKLWLRYRGHWLWLRVTHEVMDVALARGPSAPARVGFRGEVYELQQGQHERFDLRRDHPA